MESGKYYTPKHYILVYKDKEYLNGNINKFSK